MKVSEKVIEKQILEFLTLKKFFCWKNARYGRFDKKTGKFIKPVDRFQITGVADIIAIKNGKVFFIEVKTKGNYQTDNQRVFQENILSHGGVCFVARSIEDVIKKIGAEFFK